MFATLFGQKAKTSPPILTEEVFSNVWRLENGPLCLIKVLDKQRVWVIEMSDVSSHSSDLAHSYVFSKEFEMTQALDEAKKMYLDFTSCRRW